MLTKQLTRGRQRHHMQRMLERAPPVHIASNIVDPVTLCRVLTRQHPDMSRVSRWQMRQHVAFRTLVSPLHREALLPVLCNSIINQLHMSDHRATASQGSHEQRTVYIFLWTRALLPKIARPADMSPRSNPALLHLSTADDLHPVRPCGAHAPENL